MPVKKELILMGVLCTLAGSCVIAFSMYSRIPMPQLSWTEERMKYVLCFFPLVGAVMGLCLWAALWRAAVLGGIVYGVCGTVAPILLTGGIHMDGYLDVLDARASCGKQEKKLEILKDPHVGAFAVIGCSMYLLLYLALFSLLPKEALPDMGVVYVAERALSGLALVRFPKARKDGLAASFSDASRKMIVTVCMAGYLAACLGFWLWHSGRMTALCLSLAGVCIFLNYRHMAVQEFGGITGDLAGHFLQRTELVYLAILVIVYAL